MVMNNRYCHDTEKQLKKTERQSTPSAKARFMPMLTDEFMLSTFRMAGFRLLGGCVRFVLTKTSTRLCIEIIMKLP